MIKLHNILHLPQQVLVTVNDRSSLGTQLLTIAGQRVAYQLSTKEGQMVVELMANVNPALSTWLKSMVHTVLRKQRSSHSQ